MTDAYRPPTAEVLRWVARQVHRRARPVSVVRLTGGITADMDRITVDAPAGLTDVVLRRWGASTGTDGGAEARVDREAAALVALQDRAVPAPRLLASDGDGAATGTPCTLTTALPGQPELRPADRSSWLEQLATTQARIHAVAPQLPARWHRYRERERPLAWLSDPGLRRAAHDAAEGPLDGQEVLVHGDYHPMNVLWSGRRLTGVVDWPNAATGHRGSDVGHCRLNLAVLFDAATAADYLARYERAAGVSLDRRADLQALLCYQLDWREFIPRQVAGRARVDLGGMTARVTAAVRDVLKALDALGVSDGVDRPGT